MLFFIQVLNTCMFQTLHMQINIKDEMWCERFQTQTQATPDHSTCTSPILRITNTGHHFDQERVTGVNFKQLSDPVLQYLVLVLVLKLYLSTVFHVLVLVLVLEGEVLVLVLVLETKVLVLVLVLRLCTCLHAKNHFESITIYQQRNFCQS